MTLENAKFPIIVKFMKNWEVRYQQTIAGPDAYIPPVPSGCAVILECADGTMEVFPDLKEVVAESS